MSDVLTMKRPTGVTLVAVLIFLAAIVNIIFGIWLILSPIGENPAVANSLGRSQDIPTLWLIMNGVLALVLGLIYLWLGRMTLAGSQGAQMLIQGWPSSTSCSPSSGSTTHRAGSRSS